MQEETKTKNSNSEYQNNKQRLRKCFHYLSKTHQIEIDIKPDEIQQEVLQSLKVIVALGAIGTGKSSVLNSLSGGTNFEASSIQYSCTKKPKAMNLKFRNKQDSRNVIFIEFPGLGNTQGLDQHHLQKMIKVLKDAGVVHTFLLVFNAQDSLYSQLHQMHMKIFQQSFGSQFFNNSILVFTRWEVSDSAVKKRKIRRQQNEKDIERQFNKMLMKNHKIQKPLNCVFLNNEMLYNEIYKDAQDIERMAFDNSIQQIFQFVFSCNPYLNRDIQEIFQRMDFVVENYRTLNKIEQIGQKYQSSKYQLTQIKGLGWWSRFKKVFAGY